MRNLRLDNGRVARMDLYGHNPFSFRDPNLRNRESSSVDLSDLDWFSKLVQRQLGRPRGKHIRLFLSERRTAHGVLAEMSPQGRTHAYAIRRLTAGGSCPR